MRAYSKQSPGFENRPPGSTGRSEKILLGFRGLLTRNTNTKVVQGTVVNNQYI
jgi:hypothetical protein